VKDLAFQHIQDKLLLFSDSVPRENNTSQNT